MIAIGSDHRGYEACNIVENYLKDSNIKYTRVNEATEMCDYPDVARQVVRSMMDGNSKGILICYTANGMAMTANKISNVRAAVCWNVTTAEFARRHNDANILCLPAGYLDNDTIIPILQTFLNTEFEGGRHKTRVDKIPHSPIKIVPKRMRIIDSSEPFYNL